MSVNEARKKIQTVLPASKIKEKKIIRFEGRRRNSKRPRHEKYVLERKNPTRR